MKSTKKRITTSLAVLLLLACSSKSEDEPSCPNDLPAACPSSGEPSYATTIQPILRSRCRSCHSAEGEAGTTHVFDSYAEVFAERRVVLSQVFACAMPPVKADQLSEEERAALLAWLVCGAPNN